MSTILIASVAASTSSKAAAADQREELSGVEEKENVEREDLAKSQLEDGHGVTLLVPPWHAAARHASLCAVDLSIGVSLMAGMEYMNLHLIHIDSNVWAG